MIHSFLLIGQSNAAGRGEISEAGPLDTCEGKLKVLRNGRWQKMYRPVNPDRSFSGTCFAESFAKAYFEANPDVEVGIIPCADGGTTLEQWSPGGLLFDNAVNCAKLAMRTSHLVGILWHQGESECTDERYPLYRERFEHIMNTLREELNMPDLPILVGGLGDFLADYAASDMRGRYYTYVNAALQTIGEEYHNCSFVSAEGLGSKSDNLHFNAEALYEFGLRYFDVYQKMGVKNPIISSEEKEDDSIRSAMELL